MGILLDPKSFRIYIDLIGLVNQALFSIKSRQCRYQASMDINVNGMNSEPKVQNENIIFPDLA